MKALPKIRGRIPKHFNSDSVYFACLRNNIRLTIAYEPDGFLVHALCLDTGNIEDYYSFAKVLRLNMQVVLHIKCDLANDGRTQLQRDRIRAGKNRRPLSWL